ncbi:hypothetical protein AAVH_40378, partial [Aphelenchoides avenae]
LFTLFCYPAGREDHPYYPKEEIRIISSALQDYREEVDADHIGQLPQFALTEFYVPDIDNGLVQAYLQQHLPETVVVACETLRIEGFSPDEHRFRQQIALVQGLLETLKLVEQLKLQLTRHQQFAFLPKVDDFKVPSHVALRIKQCDNEEEYPTFWH